MPEVAFEIRSPPKEALRSEGMREQMRFCYVSDVSKGFNTSLDKRHLQVICCAGRLVNLRYDNGKPHCEPCSGNYNPSTSSGANSEP